MRYVPRPRASLFIDVAGDGPPIVTTHGLFASGGYSWPNTCPTSDTSSCPVGTTAKFLDFLRRVK
ncbi:MAG: hypothetical protein GY925_11445 [Actinomycetia bacterium]|nr:hypothetical protein [Actinomycetes bacterium]